VFFCLLLSAPFCSLWLYYRLSVSKKTNPEYRLIPGLLAFIIGYLVYTQRLAVLLVVSRIFKSNLLRFSRLFDTIHIIEYLAHAALHRPPQLPDGLAGLIGKPAIRCGLVPHSATLA
jgi:hypothetical protein